jgi:tripartite motif-containing protein 71
VRPAGALLALVCACVLAAVPAPASAAFRVADTWGHEGTAAGEFGSGVLGDGANRQYDDPAGIALAGDGTVLVVDTSNNRVERFTSGGRYLGGFGRRGLDKGFVEVRLTNRFFQPEGIALGPGGAIFVADTGNDRVMKFSPGGHFRKRLGKHGSYPGEYVQPWGIAVGGRSVFVADQGNYRIQRWTTGGRRRGAFGHFGRGRGELVTPYGLAATSGGDRVYVTDIIRHKVIVFSGTGKLLDEWGGPGTGAGEFLKPAGVAVARDGSVFVADRCNERIEHFTAAGQYLESFGNGVLDAPTFLDVNAAGDVYVSDHHRVVRFAPGASASAAASAPARAAQHDSDDIWCRHVAELEGVSDTVGTPNVDLPDVDLPAEDAGDALDDLGP